MGPMSELCPRTRKGLLIVVSVVCALSFFVNGNLNAEIMQNYFFVKTLQALHSDYRIVEELDLISKWADKFPDDGNLNRSAGLNLLFTGRTEVAISYLSQAQAADPKNRMTSYWLGKAFEESGEFANALAAMYQAGYYEYFPSLNTFSESEIENLARRLQKRSISPQAYFKLAKIVYETDSEIALHYFEKAFQEAPDDLDHSLGAAWFLLEHEELEAAKTFGARASAQFPRNPWAWLFLGTLHQTAGDLDQAIQNLETVLKLSSTNDISDRARIKLGEIYNSRGEYRIAIGYLETAVTNQSTKLYALLNLAQSYAGLQKCERAHQQIETAVSLIETERQEEIFQYTRRLVARECPLGQ